MIKRCVSLHFQQVAVELSFPEKKALWRSSLTFSETYFAAENLRWQEVTASGQEYILFPIRSVYNVI